MTETTTDGSGSSNTSFKPFANSNQADDGKDNDDNEMDMPPLTAQFVTVSLQQLKEKLANVEQADKSSLVYAQKVSADLVNDDHLLGFLYAEKFDIDVSKDSLSILYMWCIADIVISYSLQYK